MVTPYHLLKKLLTKFFENCIFPLEQRPRSNKMSLKRLSMFLLISLTLEPKFIKKKMNELMSELYSQLSLSIVYSGSNTIGNHFTFKDKFYKLCMSNIVYKYTCEFCKVRHADSFETVSENIRVLR